MYRLTPLKTYALDRVYEDPRCVERMERILKAIDRDPGEVVRITDENLPEVTGELAGLWPPDTVPAGQTRTFMRPLVFTTMDLAYNRRDLGPLMQRLPEAAVKQDVERIYGHLTTAIDQHPHNLDRKNNCVCWPTYNFGTMAGCPHGCKYCGAGRDGRFLTVALNLEEYMEKIVVPVIEANPWNKVFRMILNGADLISLEPEYGLHALFAETLARYEDRWGHFHTASSNVEWLADVPHKDRLVGVWSVTCEAVTQDIEPGTGHAVDRIEAARKCQEMGIPVRFKFKPIIPVKNWQAEYKWIIEQLFRRTQPESVGFCLYIWNTYESMVRALDPELLDPECLEAAKGAQEKMQGVRTGPFPHETRKSIYRFFIQQARRWDSEVPLYVSTESREMWDELKDELGQDPRSYICGCSSVATPGRRLALSPGLRYSTYHPTPV
jgi:DNA repair photolyase